MIYNHRILSCQQLILSVGLSFGQHISFIFLEWTALCVLLGKPILSYHRKLAEPTSLFIVGARQWWQLMHSVNKLNWTFCICFYFLFFYESIDKVSMRFIYLLFEIHQISCSNFWLRPIGHGNNFRLILIKFNQFSLSNDIISNCWIKIYFIFQ